MDIILASSSKSRISLLKTLKISFKHISPDIDETELENERAYDLVKRLSVAKAQKIANTHSGLIIGSDQVLSIDEQIMSKPSNHQNALSQLKFCSGKDGKFLTGVCMHNTHSGNIQQEVITTIVKFRVLSDSQINNYLSIEKPYNCAGSFRSEGLGIALCENLNSDDPTALIGLPLITVVNMLIRENSYTI